MASKSSSLPAVIGLLVLALVGGGAYWLLTSEEAAPARPAATEPKPGEQAQATPVAPQGQRTELVGTSTPFDQQLKVKVMDTAGQSLAGAEVEVREDVDPFVSIQKLVATYQTGADGSVLVKGSRAPFTVAAVAPMHVKVFQPISAPLKEITLELPTGGSVSLSFKDEITKEPVANVPVKLYAELGGKPSASYYFLAAQGSDKGTLKIAPVPQVEFTLGINHLDYDTIDENYKVGPTEMKEMAYLLKRRITLKGHVLGAVDGKPIKGVKVEVAEDTAPSVSKTLGLGTGHIRSGETDELGAFTIDKCPVGTLYIDASHPDFMTASKGPVESDTLKTTDIEMRMDRNAAIRGRVVDADENPIAGAEVIPVFAQNPFFDQQLTEQRKNSLKSSADGTFELKGIQPNIEWKIHTFHKDFLDAVSDGLTLKPGEVHDGLEIRLMKGGAISGTVRDSAGSPLQGVQVVAVFATTDRTAQTRHQPVTSGDDGSYAIPGLKPGTYNLEATLAGYCNELKRGVRYNANEVVINLAKEGVIVGQSLSAADRAPVTEYILRYRQSGIPMQQSAGLLTIHDKEGKFAVHGLKPGLYDLEVKCKDFAPQIVPAVAVREGESTDPVTVLVDMGSSLEGTISQASRDPINRALIELDPLETFDSKDKDYITLRGTSNEVGHFMIGKLLPGKYRMTVTHPKFAQVKPIDVEVQNGTNRQDITLRGGATVSVYVRDQKGEAVAGVRVVLRDKARQYMSSPGNKVRIRADTPFMSMDGGGGPTSRRQTNKEGFIMFRRMDAGDYELIVTGDQFETFRKDLTLEYEREYVEQVTLKAKGTK